MSEQTNSAKQWAAIYRFDDEEFDELRIVVTEVGLRAGHTPETIIDHCDVQSILTGLQKGDYPCKTVINLMAWSTMLKEKQEFPEVLAEGIYFRRGKTR